MTCTRATCRDGAAHQRKPLRPTDALPQHDHGQDRGGEHLELVRHLQRPRRQDRAHKGCKHDGAATTRKLTLSLSISLCSDLWLCFDHAELIGKRRLHKFCTAQSPSRAMHADLEGLDNRLQPCMPTTDSN